jgi:hypothetical protein
METNERGLKMTGLPELAFWLAAGIALGVVYLWLVGRTVAAIMGSGRKTTAAAFLVLRMALAAGAFWGAATEGALAVLMMLLGFLVTRTVAVRRAREAGDGR